MRRLCLTLAGVSVVVAAPALAQGPTFSIDFQGPMIGVPDSFVGAPITEGDILTTGVPGPPGPNPPLPGLGVIPPGIMVGSVPGAVGIFPGGLGILPGLFGCVEIDALSYGLDVLNPTFVAYFSVDEFAAGDGILIAAPDVNTEGSVGAVEASADVFWYLGPLVPTPPGPSFGNTAYADGTGTLTAADTIAFSVRRGSAVIGAPDSAFGAPIEEGDVFTVPVIAGGTPAILIAAEAAGLGTIRSGTFGPFGADDLDAIDLPEPGQGLPLLCGIGVLVLLRPWRDRGLGPRLAALPRSGVSDRRSEGRSCVSALEPLSGA